MRSVFGTTRRAAGAFCVLAGLAIAAFGVGCGDDDDDNNTPMNPNLTGEDAVEASSGVAISTVKSLEALFTTGSNPFGAVGKRRMSETRPFDLILEIAGARVPGAAKEDSPFRALVDCPGGGSMDSTCSGLGEISTATRLFSDCRFVEEDGEFILDGSVALAVSNPNFCETEEIPETGTFTLSLNDLSITARNNNVTFYSLTADFTMEVENSGEGCDGNDASIEMNGTINEFDPGEGVDATIVADELSLSVSTETMGEMCMLTMMVDGSLTATDRFGERNVHAAYDDLILTVTELPEDRVEFTIDGGVVADCLGPIEFDTIDPIIFVGGAECPADGTIEVTLEDNSRGRISFLVEGGIAFDYGADGSVDLTLASCNHDNIRDCEAAKR
jgi:hypothetical protein